MLFSQRQGYTPALKQVQIESMDEELKTRLWNAVNIHYWRHLKAASGIPEHWVKNSNLEPLLIVCWHSFFKWVVDEIPREFPDALSKVRSEFFASPWYRVYDFIEFMLSNGDYPFAEGFKSECNRVLEQENAGYRIVEQQIVPITNEIELQSIEDALNNADKFPGVKVHLTSSLSLLSDRANPDYRNSIKDSISAVESVCRTLVGDDKATLGAALKVLENHTHLHGAFKSGLSNLYGYTSDADGIRHALLEESSVSYTDAKFMLVTCSAFVNYLIGKVAELKIGLSKGT